MSRESHQKYLEAAARRAALRAKAKSRAPELKMEDVHRLKVQTMEPWKRLTLFLSGVLSGGLGFLAFSNDIFWLGLLLSILGLVLLLVALIGRRRTLETLFDAIDLGDVLSGIVDSIDISP